MQVGRTSINVFLSYAHKDEKMKIKLIEHMSVLKRQGIISIFEEHSSNIAEQWLDEGLDTADLILILVSPAYFASDYCYEIEMARAIKRHNAGEARVIPIILSPCMWQETPLGKLFALPKHFKPITEWDHREAAFADIVKNIRKVLYELEQQSYDTSNAAPTSATPLSKSSSYSSLSVYISYAWDDKHVEQTLEAHLQMLRRQASITIWHSDMISAGREWQGEIAKHLNSAHIILLLVSQNYIKDDFLFQMEMTRAMQKHKAGEARVIPIILSPCNWQEAPFGKLLALPKGGQPITNWGNAEAAFMDIVKNIGTVITELQRFGFLGATTMSAIPLSQLSPHSPLSVFISYASADELVEREIEAHLQMLQRQASITIWHPGMISAGREWQYEIDEHLSSAHIILLLVSQSYLNSEFLFQVELARAMQRYEAREARVIPIILSPCDWQQAPIGKLLALPKNGKPVAEWTNRDAAFANIVENIYVVAEELRTQHLLTAKALLTFDSASQMSQAEKEKELDRIERQLESTFESSVTSAVKKALRDSPQSKRNTAISTISLCGILILLFEMTVYYWLPSRLHWLITHPNSFGIQLTIDTFIVLAIVGYMYPGKVRIWCWGAGIFAIFGIFLQIIGGPH